MKKATLIFSSFLLLVGAGCSHHTAPDQLSPHTQSQEQTKKQSAKKTTSISFVDVGEYAAPQWLSRRIATEMPNEKFEWYAVDDPELDGVTFLATSELDMATKSVTNRIYRYTDSDDDFEVLWDQLYHPGDFTFQGFGDFEAPVFRLLGVGKDGDATRVIGLAHWYSDSPAPCANPLAFEPSDSRKYFALDIGNPDELLPAPEFDQDAIATADEQLEDCRKDFANVFGN